MTENLDEKFIKLRQASWDKALHSFGLSYIFDKKAGRLGVYVNLLKVFGIVVPIAVGATALGYGLDSNILKYSITISIPLSIVQLIFSVFAVVYKWDDELSYSFEASQDLSTLSDSFKRLGEHPPVFNELERSYELLNERFKARTQQNSKHNLKEWELRMGMRYALREFQRSCVGCRVVPQSMDSTNCDVCGKFDKSLYYKIFR